jgi:hypothetical protein
MALEDMMRHIAKGMGIDPDKIESRIQDKYMKLYQEGKSADFQALRELTGIQPQLPAEMLQERITRCIADDLYSAVRDNLEYTTRDNAVKIMQQVYQGFLDNDNLKALALSIKATNIRPPEGPVQEKYVAYLKKGRLDKVRILHNITGVPIPEEDIQKKYLCCIKQMWMTALDKIKNATGIPPKLPPEIIRHEISKRLVKHQLPDFYTLTEMFGTTTLFSQPEEAAIQEEYAHMVLHGRWDDLERLQKTTNVQPKLDPDMINQAYLAYFEIPNNIGIGKLRALTGAAFPIPQDRLDERYESYLKKGQVMLVRDFMEISGTRPSGEILQKKCDEYLMKGKLDRIPVLAEATGYMPVFAPDVVQQAYTCMLDACHIQTMKKIQEFTQTPVSLTQETIQRGYEAIARQRKPQKMAELFKLTQINPALPEEQIQNMHNLCAASGDIETIETLYQATSVRPILSVENRFKVLDTYQALAEKNEYSTIRRIRIATDIPIVVGVAYDTIQNEYRKLLSGFDVGGAKELLDNTGVSPSSIIVQEMYTLYMQNRKFDMVKQVREFTSIDANETEVQRFFSQYSRASQLSAIKELRDATGIAPCEIAYISLVKELLAE